MTHYRFATEEDNPQLTDLAASSGMTGKTSLRIDRKPDFFKLLRMRGESRVLVAVKDNNIIGSLSISLQHVYIDRKIYPVYYVADFKVLPSFRGTGIGIELCEKLTNYTISVDADMIFLTVAQGNTKPIPFFKNRQGIPDFENIGTFAVHQFIGRKISAKHTSYKIEETVPDDDVVGFLNAHYIKYELGSVITKEKLSDSGVYTIKQDNRVIAAMCLADTMNVKQNVVIKMKWYMNLLLKFLNQFQRVLNISKMPVINEPVRMIYLKYLAVKNNDPEIVKLFINYARNLVYAKSYSFVSIGLHEKDPLNKSLPVNLRLTFYSTGMLLSIKNNHELIRKVKQGVPFEDYSLV